MLQATARKFKKSLATRGVIGTLEVSAMETFQLLKNSYSPKEKPRSAWELTDFEFDNRYGVDTGGRIPLSNLAITSNNWIYGLHYQAVGIVDFWEILQPFDILYEKFTFIDLGSGKGRALLMASALPFKKIVGVEFSEELNRIAQENLSRYPQEDVHCREIELLLMDASNYRFPAGPLVLYMYNPFEQPVMARVLESLVAAFQQYQQRIIVIYYTPECSEMLNKIQFLKRIVTQPDCYIYDTGAVK
jgi:SAM-dependent methyltransferase